MTPNGYRCGRHSESMDTEWTLSLKSLYTTAVFHKPIFPHNRIKTWNAKVNKTQTKDINDEVRMEGITEQNIWSQLC